MPVQGREPSPMSAETQGPVKGERIFDVQSARQPRALSIGPGNFPKVPPCSGRASILPRRSGEAVPRPAAPRAFPSQRRERFPRIALGWASPPATRSRAGEGGCLNPKPPSPVPNSLLPPPRFGPRQERDAAGEVSFLMGCGGWEGRQSAALGAQSRSTGGLYALNTRCHPEWRDVWEMRASEPSRGPWCGRRGAHAGGGDAHVDGGDAHTGRCPRG